MTWKNILKMSSAIVILETDEMDRAKKIPRGSSYIWESSPNFHSERARAVKMAQEKVNELGKKHYFFFHRTVKKFKILESNANNNGWIRLNKQNDLSGVELLEPQN